MTPAFGIYVHWPFCQAKCPYCDFNSHVVAAVDQSRWAEALSREIDRHAEELGPRSVVSVFFGGGTPSLMAPETVETVLRRISDAFRLEPDAEITLEANPTSVEAARFAGYAAAGVNRVSLGVQALNDADLKRLGRLHDVDQALRALEIARSRFDRVSFDLIYGRQDQTLADWEAELTRALALEPDHLSLYQLTIEPGTAFGDRFARGKLAGLPDDGLGADLYDLTQDLCDAAGLPAYETSNHARPGQESRHNLIYWRAGDYAGIGPGAHGRLTVGPDRIATVAVSAPGKWLKQVEKSGSGDEARETLSAREQAIEWALMGLRLVEGVNLQSPEAEILDAGAMERLEGEGFVTRDGGRLALTRRGRPLLNAILADLVRD